METYGLPYDDAHALVQRKRFCVNPSEIFRRQLTVWPCFLSSAFCFLLFLRQMQLSFPRYIIIIIINNLFTVGHLQLWLEAS